MEDPVEYQQPGISQIQVHTKIGLSFGAALRSILRHDPDVVLVGEIRDLETAEMAIQASLTGHMVFSTLHTNDAPSAFTDSSTWESSPFWFRARSKVLWPSDWFEPFAPTAKSRSNRTTASFRWISRAWQKEIRPPSFSMVRAADRAIRRAIGERTGIHELLITGDDIKELIVQRMNANKIRQEALRRGMITLRQDGWQKVLAGMTTIEEVARVTAADLV